MTLMLWLPAIRSFHPLNELDVFVMPESKHKNAGVSQSMQLASINWIFSIFLAISKEDSEDITFNRNSKLPYGINGFSEEFLDRMEPNGNIPPEKYGEWNIGRDYESTTKSARVLLNFSIKLAVITLEREAVSLNWTRGMFWRPICELVYVAPPQELWNHQLLCIFAPPGSHFILMTDICMNLTNWEQKGKPSAFRLVHMFIQFFSSLNLFFSRNGKQPVWLGLPN